MTDDSDKTVAAASLRRNTVNESFTVIYFTQNNNTHNPHVYCHISLMLFVLR